MAQQTGAKSKVLIGFESAYDTIATEGFVVPFNSCAVKASRTQNVAATIRDSLNPVEPFDGNTDVSGQVVVPVDSIAFWYWMRAMFGNPTTSGTGPYNHVFKVQDDRPSITIEQQFPSLDTAKYFQYTGCKITSMAISAGDDGELVATFSIVGAQETIASASFDATPTTLTMARLKNNQLAVQEGGSTHDHARLVDLTVGTPVDPDQFVIGGGGIRGDAPDMTLQISGTLNTLFKNTTLLEKAVNATESSIQMTFTAAATSALDILLPEVKYSLNSPGVPGPKGLPVSLPFSAYYDDAGEASSIVVTLTNSEAHA